ncbi:Ribonuclease 3 [Mycena kentingensis (nom. inval.)]|nr:Ribonuclease 3 [Mycena kentingensis (nom. inval.)]
MLPPPSDSRPSVNSLQQSLVDFIHSPAYTAYVPLRFSSAKRSKVEQRLEILGDALLGYHLVSCLYDQFPDHDVHFIATLKGAILSNLVFTNVLFKIEGISRPSGYALEKPVADSFEAQAALVFLDEYDGPAMFSAWFDEIFSPLVDCAVSVWDRGPKSWVESCIEASMSESAPRVTGKRKWDGDDPDDGEGERSSRRRWVDAIIAQGKEDSKPNKSFSRRGKPTSNAKENRTAASSSSSCRQLNVPPPRKPRSSKRLASPLPILESAAVDTTYLPRMQTPPLASSDALISLDDNLKSAPWRASTTIPVSRSQPTRPLPTGPRRDRLWFNLDISPPTSCSPPETHPPGHVPSPVCGAEHGGVLWEL